MMINIKRRTSSYVQMFRFELPVFKFYNKIFNEKLHIWGGERTNIHIFIQRIILPPVKETTELSKLHLWFRKKNQDWTIRKHQCNKRDVRRLSECNDCTWFCNFLFWNIRASNISWSKFFCSITLNMHPLPHCSLINFNFRQNLGSIKGLLYSILKN